MSGSSRAERRLSRCVVVMDSGMSIEWAPDEDGSIEHGMQHHRDEERGFLASIDVATPAIEVVFDELESRGHTFLSPADTHFASKAQRAEVGMPIVEVLLACTPPLDAKALTRLVERVAGLINQGT